LKSINAYLTIPALKQHAGLLHAFTTRLNGLGARTNGAKHPDDWNEVAKYLSIGPDRIVTLNQVHGETIVTVTNRNYGSVKSMQADAMITHEPGIAIGVETADCVPVLLFDPLTPVVAAVHAGWRSSVKKIVRKTAAKMKEEFGSDPARMIAAIGPAIGPECYEVDEPVMGPVRETFPLWREFTTERGAGRWGLDLVEANRRELLEIGLTEKNIHSLGLCTSCRKDLFYSYRAEGRTGRMLSVIMLKT
jgi:polyphenol oxidase